jgi:hypothetical protein
MPAVTYSGEEPEGSLDVILVLEELVKVLLLKIALHPREERPSAPARKFFLLLLPSSSSFPCGVRVRVGTLQ